MNEVERGSLEPVESAEAIALIVCSFLVLIFVGFCLQSLSLYGFATAVVIAIYVYHRGIRKRWFRPEDENFLQHQISQKLLVDYLENDKQRTVSQSHPACKLFKIDPQVAMQALKETLELGVTIELAHFSAFDIVTLDADKFALDGTLSLIETSTGDSVKIAVAVKLFVFVEGTIVDQEYCIIAANHDSNLGVNAIEQLKIRIDSALNAAKWS